MMRFLTLICITLLAVAPAAAAASPPAGDSASSGDQRRRTLTPSAHYLPIDPLTATVQVDFRLRGILHIEAGLDIPDSGLRARAQRLMPRLRDAYVSVLSRYAGSNYRFGDVPDADRIASLLQAATDETLGESGARFLLGMVIIHDN